MTTDSVRRLFVAIASAALVLCPTPASAQPATPTRDSTWGTVSTVTLVGGALTALVMPRIFYADPEATVGWKARWRVSVLAPTMTLVALGMMNEYALVPAAASDRPGCDATNRGVGTCATYGGPSSHAFGAGAALGHGAAVFLVDTFKWSDGHISAPSLLGNVVLPLTLGAITTAGRAAGNHESGGQALAGLGVGLLSGAIMGLTYAMMARPECPYGSAAICW